MDFIVPEANLVPLLTFEHVYTLQSFTFIIVFSFPCNTGLGIDILFIKPELYCVSASEKNTRMAFAYYPNEKEMDPNGTQWNPM